MNKAEFLAGLRDALAGKLPSGELEDVLSYYEEYFADAGEEHEAEAAEGLGSPASVAAQVLEGRTGQAPSAASAGRRPRRLWPVVLGICAAARSNELQVTGVEQVPSAVACARRNADANGVADRCRFVAADATSWMEREGRDQRFDTVIVDPPRAGSTPEFLAGGAGGRARGQGGGGGAGPPGAHPPKPGG